MQLRIIILFRREVRNNKSYSRIARNYSSETTRIAHLKDISPILQRRRGTLKIDTPKTDTLKTDTLKTGTSKTG